MASKMTRKTKYPVKLIGKTSWSNESVETAFDVGVKRAFLRSRDEIRLEIVVSEYEYDVILTRGRGPHYAGEFNGIKGQKASPVKASCSLYSNEDGYFLFGNWLEDNYEYKWWVELNPVKHFSDEAR